MLFVVNFCVCGSFYEGILQKGNESTEKVQEIKQKGRARIKEFGWGGICGVKVFVAKEIQSPEASMMRSKIDIEDVFWKKKIKLLDDNIWGSLIGYMLFL